MTDIRMDHEDTWEILDPDTCKQIAVFYDEQEATAYLQWRNYQRTMRGLSKGGYRP